MILNLAHVYGDTKKEAKPGVHTFVPTHVGQWNQQNVKSMQLQRTNFLTSFSFF